MRLRLFQITAAMLPVFLGVVADAGAFTPPAADEHPRLFFRRADLPSLRQKAQTPEGRAIVERLKVCLGGGDKILPPNMASQRNPMGHGAVGPLGTWTLWHAAGFGMLYQLTGEKKYADLGREAMEIAYDGKWDAPAYSWKKPESYLRAGPSVAAVAMAYDLCFDGWDPAFRQRVAKDLLAYDVQGGAYRVTMAQIVKGGNHGPDSNHHASSLGGGGMAMLAIRGDTGVDGALVEKYLKDVDAAVADAFKRGMGENGYFWEALGPGQIASDTCFVPMLQAFRVAAGKDYAATYPGAKWLALRWPAWLMPDVDGDEVVTPIPVPGGSYGSEDFRRHGLSRGGQFSQGFGLLTNPDERAAMLWSYKTFVEPVEQAKYGAEWQFGGKPSYDAFYLPHRAALALVNWPIGVAPKNPAGILPKTMGDRVMGYYFFRNRWQDAQDIFVGVLTGSRPPVKGAKHNNVFVWGLGERHGLISWNQTGAASHYEGFADGSGAVTHGADAVAVDFSKASGADAVIVMTGPSAAQPLSGTKGSWTESGKNQNLRGVSKISSITVADRVFTIMVLAANKQFPEPRAAGDKLAVGGQTFHFDGKRLTMTKTAGPISK